MSLVVIDADVVGRQRTGDETYVTNLLRRLPEPIEAAGLELLAVTRHPELVPSSVRALTLDVGSQERRMSWSLPRLLRRVGAALVHTQYAIPLRCPCPAVVTIHDLSFEDATSGMSRRDRIVFRRVVPRAARRARRILTVSQRTRDDLVALYGIPAERILVTPNGVDPVFGPSGPSARPVGEKPFALCVGAIQPRKNQLAALAAASQAGLALVVVGPVKDAAAATSLEQGGAVLEGYVPAERLAELYRGATCLVQPSRFEGFGLPVVEAMACGTPVVAVREPALVEVAGEAAVIVDQGALAEGIRRATVEREPLVAAGLRRAAAFSWETTAELTVRAYLEALGR